LRAVTNKRIENLCEWRKTHGTAAFLKRYQNEIIDPDTQRFPRLWFDGGEDTMAPPGGYPGCLDHAHGLGEERREGWTYITGVDPASGTHGSHTVRFSCVTLGCDFKNDPTHVYLVDLDYGQQPMVSDNPVRESQVDIVLRHVLEYGSRIVLETNNVQGVWAQAIRQEARRRGVIVNITGHQTTSEKKVDPTLGIEAMAPMVENGYFRLPYKDATDKRKVESLVEEFTYWGVFATDDILMGTWFGWRVLERMKRSHAIKPAEHRVIPSYRSIGDRWSFGPAWTQKQKAVFLGLAEAEPDENCC
jgi:hypothetical protein